MLGPYVPTVAAPEQHTVKFRFRINGTSDPDSIVPSKMGITDIVRTGAGVFDITFDTAYPVFVGLLGNVMGIEGGSVVNDQLVKCDPTSDYVSSTGVLTITVVGALDTAAAAEDPADNSWVYVEATFCRRSTLSPQDSI